MVPPCDLYVTNGYDGEEDRDIVWTWGDIEKRSWSIYDDIDTCRVYLHVSVLIDGEGNLLTSGDELPTSPIDVSMVVLSPWRNRPCLSLSLYYPGVQR